MSTWGSRLCFALAVFMLAVTPAFGASIDQGDQGQDPAAISGDSAPDGAVSIEFQEAQLCLDSPEGESRETLSLFLPAPQPACSGDLCGCYDPPCNEQCAPGDLGCFRACRRDQIDCGIACCGGGGGGGQCCVRTGFCPAACLCCEPPEV
jgi:hypothetical protein